VETIEILPYLDMAPTRSFETPPTSLEDSHKKNTWKEMKVPFHW
jgi:hypothetical protein